MYNYPALQSLAQGGIGELLQQAQARQQQSQLQAAQFQQAHASRDQLVQAVADKNRDRQTGLLAAISQLPAEKQAEAYSLALPNLQRLVPDTQLPDQWNPLLGQQARNQALGPDKLATLDIEQQQLDQAKYSPVHDYLGNVTGFVDTKSGTVIDNPKAALAPAANPDGTRPTGEDYLKTLPADQASLVKSIGEGAMKLSSLGRGKVRDTVSLQLNTAYPDYDEHAYDTLTDFNKGKLGNAVRSANVANDHLDTLLEYAKALKNGDSRALNAAANAFQTQFGQPAPTNFDAVKGIVGDEVTKAVLGGAGALADRDENKKQLAAAASPDQIIGAVQGYKSLMRGQLDGLRTQYQNLPGTVQKRFPFESRLTEQTRKEILGEGQGGNAQDPRVQQALDAGYTMDEIDAYLKGKK